MFCPEKYAEHNKVSHRDSTKCLEDYMPKFIWNKHTDLSVIDIGCGDGSITAQILPKYLPDTAKELMGCDVNENMVAYSTEHHGSQRINFRLLDIEDNLPEQFRNRFDYAFSFYALHWVQNQRKAFSNIYDLLAPGGSTLITIIGKQQIIYSVYRILSRSSKWNIWLSNVEDIVSPYHDISEPETKIKNIMVEVGFTDVEAECKKVSFCMGTAQEFKKFVRSINPFHIPEDLFDDYLNEIIKIGQNMGYLDENFKYDYYSITTYGKKPKD